MVTKNGLLQVPPGNGAGSGRSGEGGSHARAHATDWVRSYRFSLDALKDVFEE